VGCPGTFSISGVLLAYQVIARKWRPQSFHDLVGQEHISTTLLNALRNNRLPQALLFTGVRGTGKTSSARILAKSLRCPNSVDFVPCGICRECEDIANSRSLDVIEIDGASNNGVDAIRELRETVGYMPSSGKYKVYIIDEVHMLSTSAFNALLKTLEEPPAHVVFIMATTEAQKIPNTILSRCQRFDFRRIPSRQIAAQLQKISEAEGVSVEPEAVWLIARQADGSMRDSQSLLDQVITFAAGKLTLAKAVEVLGLTDRTVLLETLTALVTRNTEMAVDLIEKIFKAGYDPKIFAQDLLEEIRNALMVRLVQDDPTRVVDLPDNEIASLREITADLSEEDLHLLFDMCLKGVNDLLRSQDSRIVLEMLLLRMAAAPRVASLAALASGAPLPVHASAGTKPAPRVPSKVSIAKAAPAAQPSVSAPATVRIPFEDKKFTVDSFTRPAAGQYGAPSDGVKLQPNPANAPKPATPVAPSPVHAAEASYDDAPKADPAKANDPWYQFVEQVKKSNSLLGAMLENTHLISSEASKLTIGLPKKMSFMFDKVKDPENLKRVETFVQALWNKAVTVDVKLSDETAVIKTAPKAQAEEKKAQAQKSVENQVESDPLIQQAQNVFKAQIKSIKET
jgi:DNA polymerase-3 subunit gamma/tau